MSTFHDRVKNVINDKGLHTTMERATSQLGEQRIAAFSSLDDSDFIRDQARKAKLDILGNLENNLLQFEEKLIGNGVSVHWAVDGTEACEIVSEIARRRKVRKVVKSKSMVTEEINLNDHLINAGIEVVETDLGEYIVQLAGDRPSHIIAPIIHMTREKVGKIMQEKCDVPFTDDIQELARIARAKLRQEFLQADMGITGANFGVVETGTICLVTNEGNARMVTSLPKTHIVLMGIEKLIPSLSDLDKMLKILARSATGQKLSSYTTLINGPAIKATGGGPEEMHVILLDNGRADLLNSEQAEILACIRCGACLNVCPVYKSIGGHAYGDVYPGPVGSIVTPGIRGLDGWQDLPYASTLCGACKDVCPLRIDIPGMLLKLRQKSVSEGLMPFGASAAFHGFGFTATHSKIYKFSRMMIGYFLGLLSSMDWIGKSRLPLVKSWTYSRDFKVTARKSFQDMWGSKSKNNGN